MDGKEKEKVIEFDDIKEYCRFIEHYDGEISLRGARAYHNKHMIARFIDKRIINEKERK